MQNVKKLFVYSSSSLRDVMQVVQNSGVGIAILVNAKQHLLGTITDGDIRRFILHEGSLDSSITDVIENKSKTNYAKPISANVKSPKKELMEIMKTFVIHQLPLIDGENKVVDLITLDELVPENLNSLQAVVMAGGFGKRLSPMTKNTPKPMLSIGDKPVMEHIISKLSKAGIKNVNVSTHYLPEKIREYFGDGSEFGVEMDYIPEDKPLGTAGGLGLMERPSDTTLVINGDILSEVNYQAMLSFHREHKSEITVAVREYDIQVPYGVIQSEGVFVKALEEKPVKKFFVNAGMYLIEPSAYDLIPKDDFFNMTDLIEKMLEEGKSVANFPIVEYWLDIGKPDDFKQAQQDIIEGKYSGG